MTGLFYKYWLKYFALLEGPVEEVDLEACIDKRDSLSKTTGSQENFLALDWKARKQNSLEGKRKDMNPVW